MTFTPQTECGVVLAHVFMFACANEQTNKQTHIPITPFQGYESTMGTHQIMTHSLALVLCILLYPFTLLFPCSPLLFFPLPLSCCPSVSSSFFFAFLFHNEICSDVLVVPPHTLIPEKNNPLSAVSWHISTLLYRHRLSPCRLCAMSAGNKQRNDK